MAYKKIDQYFSFADIAIQNNVDKNRSLIFLNKVDQTIEWEPVEVLLTKYYQPGKANKGERAYEHALTPEGKLDKNGNKKKFSRDLDSDWTIKNDEPHYGLKEHAAVDTENGFILSTILSPASHNDSPYLPRAIIYSMHTEDKIKTVYADKGYPGAPNRNFLALNKIKDGIMRKDEKNAKLTQLEIERNKSISKLRYIVEQYFGISHKYDNGNQARFPEIMKNIIDIMFRQFAFNLKKGAKILEVLPG